MTDEMTAGPYIFVESETPHPEYPEIKYRMFHPIVGTTGGWVEDPKSVSRSAWVDRDSVVRAGASVLNHARVIGRSVLSSGITVAEHATVMDFVPNNYAGEKMDVHISGYAVVKGRILFEGKVVIDNDAEVLLAGRYLSIMNSTITGGAYVEGHGTIQHSVLTDDATAMGCVTMNGAYLAEKSHFLFITPFGSEGQDVTLYPTKGGEGGGHVLAVGCWSGTVDELKAEVERRSRHHWGNGIRNEYRKALKSQYKMLEALVRDRIEMWTVAKW